MTPDHARQLALGLPEAVEQDHHGRPSFRVGGKIFATLWDERTMNVMVDEPGIRTAIERHPEWCTERYWGRRLAAVAVDLEGTGRRTRGAAHRRVGGKGAGKANGLTTTPAGPTATGMLAHSPKGVQRQIRRRTSYSPQ